MHQTPQHQMAQRESRLQSNEILGLDDPWNIHSAYAGHLDDIVLSAAEQKIIARARWFANGLERSVMGSWNAPLISALNGHGWDFLSRVMKNLQSQIGDRGMRQYLRVSEFIDELSRHKATYSYALTVGTDVLFKTISPCAILNTNPLRVVEFAIREAIDGIISPIQLLGVTKCAMSTRFNLSSNDGCVASEDVERIQTIMALIRAHIERFRNEFSCIMGILKIHFSWMTAHGTDCIPDQQPSKKRQRTASPDEYIAESPVKRMCVDDTPVIVEDCDMYFSDSLLSDEVELSIDENDMCAHIGTV